MRLLRSVLACFASGVFCCFFFTAPAPPAIYTLSLHDALPISRLVGVRCGVVARRARVFEASRRGHDALGGRRRQRPRSEEHTSELQSRFDLVCRLLLEKKKKSWPSLGSTVCRWSRKPSRGRKASPTDGRSVPWAPSACPTSNNLATTFRDNGAPIAATS